MRVVILSLSLNKSFATFESLSSIWSLWLSSESSEVLLLFRLIWGFCCSEEHSCRIVPSGSWSWFVAGLTFWFTIFCFGWFVAGEMSFDFCLLFCCFELFITRGGVFFFSFFPPHIWRASFFVERSFLESITTFGNYWCNSYVHMLVIII